MRRGRLPAWVTLVVVPAAVALVVLGSAALLAPRGTTGPAPGPEPGRIGPLLTLLAPEVEALPDPPHTRPPSETTRSPCRGGSDAVFAPALQRRWYLTQDVSGTGFHPEITTGARQAVRSLARSLLRDGWRGASEPDDYGSVRLTGTGAWKPGRVSIYCFGDRILLRVSVAGRDVCRHLP